MMIGTCPPITSESAGPLPLYGTCVRSTWASRLQELAREMRRRAGPRRGKGQLPGLRLGGVEHLLQRLVRRARVDGEHERVAAEQDHGLERLDRIVRHVGIDARIDRVRADRASQDRVAIGLRLGDEIGADVAACAGLVLDHDGLPERCRELLAEQARERIGVAADGERNDVHDRLGRPRGLRLRRTGSAGEQRTTHRCDRDVLHDALNAHAPVEGYPSRAPVANQQTACRQNRGLTCVQSGLYFASAARRRDCGCRTTGTARAASSACS